MKRNDYRALPFKNSTPISALFTLVVFVTLLMCSNCGSGPELAPLAGNRLVLASKGPNNSLDIRMSIDGQVWTAPIGVTINGAPATNGGTPAISYDGTLYHLYWIEPGGSIRYATSRTGTQWLGQSDPLLQLPSGTGLSLARGGSKAIAVIHESGGRIVALDTASTTASRHTITQSATRDHSVAYGTGKFVVAVARTTGNVEIFASTDEGTTWNSISAVQTPDSYGVDLDFSDGQFSLMEKPYANPRCRLFTSPDAVTWTEAANPGCSNRSQGQLATRYKGETIVYENYDNTYLRANKNSTSMQDLHANSVNGQFTVTTGKGPQMGAWHLNQVTVNRGSAQDITLVAISFGARVGVPNSARVGFSGRLDEFASNLNAGQSAPIPPYASPFAWLIEPTERPEADDGHLDIVGAIVVGIDRGACPVGPIRDRVNEVMAGLLQELNTQLAGNNLGVLRDPANQRRILNDIAQAVKRRLNPGNPSNPLFTLFEDIGTSVGCGFNRDEQFVEQAVVLVGSEIVQDDPAHNFFNFLHWNQSLSVATESVDGSKSWSVEGNRLLLPQ